MDFAETARAVFEEYAPKILEAYKAEIDPKKASGILASTAKMTITVDESVTLSINLQEYWKYVEYGRQPFGKFPPLDKIAEWIEVKGIKPQIVELPGGRYHAPSDDTLVFLIARKIARDGIKPTNALERAVSQFKNAMRDAIVKRWRKGMLIDFNKIFK